MIYEQFDIESNLKMTDMTSIIVQSGRLSSQLMTYVETK